MEEIWTEKYRPSNLSEVVGQTPITDRLKNYVKERSMPHLLFACLLYTSDAADE